VVVAVVAGVVDEPEPDPDPDVESPSVVVVVSVVLVVVDPAPVVDVVGATTVVCVAGFAMLAA
jgi:hypothetical protein